MVSYVVKIFLEMPVKKFGWRRFIQRRWHFRRSKMRALERWFLIDLHSPSSLNALAVATASRLSNAGVRAAVSVNSVWIDGTPQAVGQTALGPVKCELGDLLLIANVTDGAGTPLWQHGLLIQAKMSARYNLLPSGGSTTTERRLLEHLDRTIPLNVYRDYAAKSPIGSYKIGGSTKGLADCARYLLMPSRVRWVGQPRYKFGPYQVGWPSVHPSSSVIFPPIGIVQAVQELCFGSLGRPIVSPLICGWSQLVHDLLGSYQHVVMRGYGKQRRVNASKNVCSFATLEYATKEIGTVGYILSPPPDDRRNEPTEPESPPNISVIVVNIRLADKERLD